MLHLVFITLTLFISLSFLLCCPHACCSPSLHLTLFISRGVHDLVSTLCFGAMADCSGGLQYTQGGVRRSQDVCVYVCVYPHAYTHAFSDGGLSSYFSVFDSTCLGGGSIHCAKPCGLPQKKQTILCVFACLCYCVSYRQTHIHK